MERAKAAGVKEKEEEEEDAPRVCLLEASGCTYEYFNFQFAGVHTLCVYTRSHMWMYHNMWTCESLPVLCPTLFS